MKRALRPGGIVCSQADTFWGHLKNATSMRNHCKEVFAKAAYATSYVSTYPAGQIGFALGSLNEVIIMIIIIRPRKFYLPFYTHRNVSPLNPSNIQNNIRVWRRSGSDSLIKHERIDY